MLNDGFNRYSLNSKEDLPSWFLDDESKHYKSNIPITKEAVTALRARQRALDARPIKKVAEANLDPTRRQMAKNHLNTLYGMFGRKLELLRSIAVYKENEFDIVSK